MATTMTQKQFDAAVQWWMRKLANNRLEDLQECVRSGAGLAEKRRANGGDGSETPPVIAARRLIAQR